MSVYACSLAVDDDQPIGPSGGYQLIRLPYGDVESYDGHDMHPAEQPDGVVSEFPDDRSALIWPAVDGWSIVEGVVHLEPGDYTEFRFRIIRDPLNLSTGHDSTRSEHRAPSPGGQYWAFSHLMYARVGTPLAIAVAHNASHDVAVTYAQFKLAIFA
ncbi:hypothetical protein CDO52_00695 [Nocardiopsis gilva YIM 90087]|uniref:Uncharacterized protein n=1 Tax=Nocardiopsis gilva YIM 90087 TaxID=1235441 RepID=A0A223S078_9ACTN|nr:hypothetical protein [Nocardiopsis gilva]ASU81497.1 hypothetical protein CDO52_00695 [Nocardiopsis gilva YIM 90087]